MRYSNPFKPTAGAEPPVLIGRERVVDDFLEGIRDGVGAPGRLLRITGPRGSGKTVLLTELGDLARAQGWEVVDETAGEGLPSRVCRALQKEPAQVRLEAGVNAVILKGSLTATRQEGVATLRETLSRVVAQQTKRDKGLLVTVDEIQDADADDIREIAAAVQHLIRERQNIAFVFAGLTTGVLDLINGSALTFLRRAKPEELGSIPLDEVADALQETIEASGMHIGKEALQSMAEATAGYAYLIQLVGYHVWRRARTHVPESTSIAPDDVSQGVADALVDFANTVLEPALSRVPLRAMEYAIAMSQDEGVSSTAAVAERLGVAPSSLTSYRRMLIREQVIEPTARGYVTFSIPFMREYVRSHTKELLARYGR